MKIAIIGYGKMGKAIEQVALQKHHEVILKINDENLPDLNIESLSKADVAIEFTQPDAAFDNVMKCIAADIPVVSGTTGWNKKVEEAEKICLNKNGTFFHSSNFSIGVNIFFEINRKLAELAERFPQYNEIWITETHHTAKKDSPSGTAITLADDMLKYIRRLRTWKNYHSGNLMTTEEEENPTILPINSHRIGDAAGIHEVDYESEEDGIQIIHHAKGRTGFAKGAVMAAEFVLNKKGVYGMKDLLGI